MGVLYTERQLLSDAFDRADEALTILDGVISRAQHERLSRAHDEYRTSPDDDPETVISRIAESLKTNESWTEASTATINDLASMLYGVYVAVEALHAVYNSVEDAVQSYREEIVPHFTPEETREDAAF